MLVDPHFSVFKGSLTWTFRWKPENNFPRFYKISVLSRFGAIHRGLLKNCFKFYTVAQIICHRHMSPFWEIFFYHIRSIKYTMDTVAKSSWHFDCIRYLESELKCREISFWLFISSIFDCAMSFIKNVRQIQSRFKAVK